MRLINHRLLGLTHLKTVIQATSEQKMEKQLILLKQQLLKFKPWEKQTVTKQFHQF
jgi:hypothetical protein